MDMNCCSKPGIFSKLRDVSGYLWNKPAENQAPTDNFLVNCQNRVNGTDPLQNTTSAAQTYLPQANVHKNEAFNEADMMACFEKGVLKDTQVCKIKAQANNWPQSLN